MKSASQQTDPGRRGEYETAAEFLEDLAEHADSDQEKQQCLAEARNFRVAARSTASHKRSKGKKKATPVGRRTYTGGQHG